MYFGSVVYDDGHAHWRSGRIGDWLFVIPGLAVLATRILDEEKVLRQELAGYDEYTQQVHYRLVPGVW